jgi:FKBP-type peptidyl-prolyl cis-trans isomerase
MTPIAKGIIFVGVAALLLWYGSDYNARVEREAAEDAAKLQASMQAQREEILKKLVKEDVVTGTGREAKVGDTVTVHYVGTFLDGKEFDSSRRRNEPFTVQLGAGQVIAGWDAGLPGMKVGGTRKLTVPPELAYGSMGAGPIPPDATLKFEVELLEVK